MLIRSQDGKYLVPMGQLMIIEDPVSANRNGESLWLIITPTNYVLPGGRQFTWLELGAYFSEGRAIEVLNDIETEYEKSLCSDSFPSEDAHRAIPRVIVYNTVFQMPEPA